MYVKGWRRNSSLDQTRRIITSRLLRAEWSSDSEDQRRGTMGDVLTRCWMAGRDITENNIIFYHTADNFKFGLLCFYQSGGNSTCIHQTFQFHFFLWCWYIIHSVFTSFWSSKQIQIDFCHGILLPVYSDRWSNTKKSQTLSIKTLFKMIFM